MQVSINWVKLGVPETTRNMLRTMLTAAIWTNDASKSTLKLRELTGLIWISDEKLCLLDREGGIGC